MENRPLHYHKTSFFFFNDTATTEIYTLSLHDALPIPAGASLRSCRCRRASGHTVQARDRKSTRLNSSHGSISYAVVCLKKKKNYRTTAESDNFIVVQRGKVLHTIYI